jgi:alpha-L-fucosidase
MGTNGSAIYATRPWKIYGTGPGTHATSADAKFNENKRKELTSEDIRFTTKGQTLYAFLMGWPEKPPVIEPLATRGKYFAGHVRNVELLGREGKLDWTQDASGLRVQLPHEKPGSHAFALKIEGLDLQALP